MGSSKFQLLRDRFPEHCDVIAQLASENNKFKDLVQDCADSCKAMARWKHSDHPMDPDRVDEYNALQKELLLEMRQF